MHVISILCLSYLCCSYHVVLILSMLCARYWEAIKKWDEALLLTPDDGKMLEMKAQVKINHCSLWGGGGVDVCVCVTVCV